MPYCKEGDCMRECFMDNEYCSVHASKHAKNLVEKGACAYLAVVCDSKTLNEGFDFSENLAETVRKETNSDFLAGTTMVVGSAVTSATSIVVQGVKYINKIGWGNAVKIGKALFK